MQSPPAVPAVPAATEHSAVVHPDQICVHVLELNDKSAWDKEEEGMKLEEVTLMALTVILLTVMGIGSMFGDHDFETSSLLYGR
eukprot:g1466.t1